MSNRYPSSSGRPIPPAVVGKLGLAAAALLAALIFWGQIQTTVEPGHIGVRVTLGTVDESVLNPGFFWKWPFVQQIVDYDVRVQIDRTKAAAASKDLQDVAAELGVNFHPNPGAVYTIHNTIGTGYKERIIDPAVQEAFKATTAQYTASELITKREEVKVKARDELTERLKKYHIILDDLSIINFDFSKDFNAAIEASNVARQNVIKLQQELEQAKVNAEREVVTAEANARAREATAKGQAAAEVAVAEGHAKATILKGDSEAHANRAIAQSITPALLALRKIELVDSKWNGTVPQTIFSGDGSGANGLTIVPVLNR